MQKIYEVSMEIAGPAAMFTRVIGKDERFQICNM